MIIWLLMAQYGVADNMIGVIGAFHDGMRAFVCVRRMPSARNGSQLDRAFDKDVYYHCSFRPVLRGGEPMNMYGFTVNNWEWFFLLSIVAGRKNVTDLLHLLLPHRDTSLYERAHVGAVLSSLYGWSVLQGALYERLKFFRQRC